MIVPFSLIPREYLEPLQVETTIEYALEDDKFPGLNDYHYSAEPALMVGPMYSRDCNNHRLDNTTPGLEACQSDSITGVQQFPSKYSERLSPLTWTEASTHPGSRLCTGYAPSTLVEEICFSHERQTDSKHHEDIQQQTPEPIQQWNMQQQQPQQQRHHYEHQWYTAPEGNIAMLNCTDERIVDLTVFWPSSSCNLISYGRGFAATSSGGQDLRRLPKKYIVCACTSREAEASDQSNTYVSSAYRCIDCGYYGNRGCHDETTKNHWYLSDFSPEYMRHCKEEIPIHGYGRKRVSTESSDDFGGNSDRLCPKRRRCDTGDYFCENYQREAIPTNSYTNLTNVANYGTMEQ